MNTALRKALALLVLPVALLSALLLGPVEPARATSGGCYGAACTGSDPQGLCSSDAYTVASTWVDGVANLEFRYSPSCAASWARITYAVDIRATIRLLLAAGNVLEARASVWIEGEPSQGIVNAAQAGGQHTAWTAMVDGTVRNCIGGQVKWAMPGATEYSPSNIDWGAWTWGPCA